MFMESIHRLLNYSEGST